MKQQCGLSTILVLLAITLIACSQNMDITVEPAGENNSTGYLLVDRSYQITENDTYIDLVDVDENYQITDYAQYSGMEYQYVIYELENPDSRSGVYGQFIDQYWVVIVLKNGEVFSIIRQEAEDIPDTSKPSTSNLVLEADVNFDGENDVLVCLGHFGAQGLVRYACYLNAIDGFVECPSFSNISNPAIDATNHVILSSWRNWAASHSWAFYSLVDGEYIMMEKLTEELIIKEDGKEIWTWSDEVFEGGSWQIREYFTTEDYDAETLRNEKVYGEGSYWDITQDRWRSFYWTTC